MSYKLDLPCNVILIGMTKSGKTHLLKCLIGLHADFFNYGLCFSSTSFSGDYDYLPDEYVYEEYDENIIRALMNKQRQYLGLYKEGKIKSMPEAFIILDDQLGLVEFHKKNNVFDVLFSKGRHLHISCFLSIQMSSYLSPCIRYNSMYIFITVIHGGAKTMMYEISRGFKSEKEFNEFLDENCVDHKVVVFDNSDAYEKQYIKIIKAPENIPDFYLDY
jgi:hypothetical protein